MLAFLKGLKLRAYRITWLKRQATERGRDAALHRRNLHAWNLNGVRFLLRLLP